MGFDHHETVTTAADKAAVLIQFGLNRGDLATRVSKGETITHDYLTSLGFNRWDVRNIAGFVNTGNVITLFHE